MNSGSGFEAAGVSDMLIRIISVDKGQFREGLGGGSVEVALEVWA